MSDVAIKIENISKLYQLGTVSTQTLYGDLHRWWARMRGKDDPYQKVGTSNSLNTKDSEFVWALRDINLEIKHGDIVGIIGRNGAGKSTLLKILSRVTAPTTGQITVNGRIASLLEVGTGFHPELTGRENVFLNGAIMGMTKTEIKRKFDEIVEFSGVEKYIDTPVKRYSSGMYVRLAFAVAAHLDPEILIVDEVLAVGDTIFQKKCIDKMTDISKDGRTILFVSHNISALKALCKTAVLLKNGSIEVPLNNINTVIDYYTSDNELKIIDQSSINLNSIKRNHTNSIVFDSLSFDNFPFKFGEKIVFNIKLKSIVKRKYVNLELGIAISDNYQSCIIHLGNRFVKKFFDHSDDTITYVFETENNLKPDTYLLTLFLRSEDTILDWIQNAVQFQILDGNPYGYLDTSQLQGRVFPKFDVYTK